MREKLSVVNELDLRADALRRAEVAEARCALLAEEVTRVRSWWRTTLIAVTTVAVFAILMLGIVAFNAVD